MQAYARSAAYIRPALFKIGEGEDLAADRFVVYCPSLQATVTLLVEGVFLRSSSQNSSVRNGVMSKLT